MHHHGFSSLLTEHQLTLRSFTLPFKNTSESAEIRKPQGFDIVNKKLRLTWPAQRAKDDWLTSQQIAGSPSDSTVLYRFLTQLKTD